MPWHLNVPRYDSIFIRRFNCPTCKKERYSLTVSQEWYGVRTICLKCGEQWGDGERMERPFMPKWRQKSIEEARKTWARYKRVHKSSSKDPQGQPCLDTSLSQSLENVGS
jgi:hypothetical protein